jgi:hypothetical protein
MSSAELPRTHRGYSMTDVGIIDVGHVREASTAVQRRDPAEAIDLAKAIEAYDSEPASIPAPPWEETIARANG